ncbi:MAG TPA: MlaD family protein [Dongiaceae bacterium]|jgi:phospholipid/cholesterol/gamma-HCH transport system substrate-binding protein|nr:MlaD family protein [Dongiaceae bacterium]
MIRVRHTDEWVGALVIAAVALLLIAALQAGVLRDWFKPTEELRLVLPTAGVGGLEVGADVEILGTKAGRVQQIVLDPNQQMYAMIEIDEQATAFIRRDSTAIIRRRFGVAGAAFVDISRGAGEEMDWTYAVIEATTERAPTDSVSALIDEVRQKVFPILDNAGKVTQSLAEIVDRVNRGEGNVGRLLVDRTLVDQTEATVGSAREAMTALNALMAELQKSAGNLDALTQKAGGPDGVPAVLAQANAALAALKKILEDVSAASQRMPAIAKNVEGSTANLPALLTQLQVTIQKLDQLVAQLQKSWLLGGGAAQPQEPKQFSPSQVLP